MAAFEWDSGRPRAALMSLDFTEHLFVAVLQQFPFSLFIRGKISVFH
jgi:hypothetical protein